jgi:hypothetical protein
MNDNFFFKSKNVGVSGFCNKWWSDWLESVGCPALYKAVRGRLWGNKTRSMVPLLGPKANTSTAWREYVRIGEHESTHLPFSLSLNQDMKKNNNWRIFSLLVTKLR